MFGREWHIKNKKWKIIYWVNFQCWFWRYFFCIGKSYLNRRNIEYFFQVNFLGHVWFPKNLRENVKKRKKIKENENWFKFNKLFLYVSSNLFYLFFSIIERLNNLKIYKFQINFNYILFYFIFSIVKSNMRKPFFLTFFFLFLIFYRNQT